LPGIFAWQVSGVQNGVKVPYWFLAPLIAAAAYVPWIKRFSLRTMLIATTVAAIALGAIVAFSR
jgi:hypothetical protein